MQPAAFVGGDASSSGETAKLMFSYITAILKGSPKLLQCILRGQNPSYSRPEDSLQTTNVNLLAALKDESTINHLGSKKVQQLLGINMLCLDRYFCQEWTAPEADSQTLISTSLFLTFHSGMPIMSNSISDPKCTRDLAGHWKEWEVTMSLRQRSLLYWNSANICLDTVRQCLSEHVLAQQINRCV